jgi:perosamine synthetase
LEASNAQRREIFLQYSHAFKDLDWFEAPVEKSHVRSAMHAYVAKVVDRDGLIAHLNNHQITAGVHYKPCHLFKVYEPYRRVLPVVDAVWPKLITLPLFPQMTEKEVGQIVDAVHTFQPNGSLSF